MYEFAVTPAVTQLRRPGVIITEVAPGSVSDEIALVPGDRIVRVNGRPVRDYLDFRFQTAGETELHSRLKRLTAIRTISSLIEKRAKTSG
jgi:S1-C subfamily serine protease